MQDITAFYLQQKEPLKSCLLALREIILSKDKEITTALKYGMPFFCFRGKMFCYLWTDKKTNQPYLGFVEGRHLDDPQLVAGNRARMKILLFDAEKDLPVRKINSLLQQAIQLYKKGTIPLKR